jgi:deoxycytidylate deaminase
LLARERRAELAKDMDYVRDVLAEGNKKANAIANAARVGTPLEGCALLVTSHPCMSCAKTIVQAGIKQVVCPEPEAGFASRWAEDIKRTRALFYECGVHLITFEEAAG